MITYKTGNIFDEDVEALVNPVNCVGVMGKGLALEFKKRFPNNYKMYQYEYKCKNLFPGNILPVIESLLNKNNPKIIFNFPTKDHWKNSSKLEYIERGLKDIIDKILFFKIKSIAIPALGCGLGGLQWKSVKELIEKYLGDLDCNIIVFEPKK